MDYNINETDILRTIQDISMLCEYIGEHKPSITKKGNLSHKVCYELNNKMSHPRQGVKPTDHMPRYEAISLYWRVALSIGIVSCDARISSKSHVALTDRYEGFKQMNEYTQYLLIFMSWMTLVDIREAYEEDLYVNHFQGCDIDYTFHFFGKMNKPEWLTLSNRIFGIDPIHVLSNMFTFVHHLSDLALLEYSYDYYTSESRRYPQVLKVMPTEAGIALMGACESRRFTWLNALEEPMAQSEYDQEVYETDFERSSPLEEAFWKPFIDCFPENAIDYRAIGRFLFDTQDEHDFSKCALLFKVELQPKCYRMIQCTGTSTFEDLHKAIQQAFDFDDDHLYVFYPDGSRSSRQSRRGIYSPYFDGDGQFRADEIRLCDIRFQLGQRLTYLFDFGDEWEFLVTLISIDHQAPLPIRPIITESVGEAPSQYRDYDY